MGATDLDRRAVGRERMVIGVGVGLLSVVVLLPPHAGKSARLEIAHISGIHSRFILHL